MFRVFFVVLTRETTPRPGNEQIGWKVAFLTKEQVSSRDLSDKGLCFYFFLGRSTQGLLGLSSLGDGPHRLVAQNAAGSSGRQRKNFVSVLPPSSSGGA